jgi:hypothetical protein
MTPPEQELVQEQPAATQPVSHPQSFKYERILIFVSLLVAVSFVPSTIAWLRRELEALKVSPVVINLLIWNLVLAIAFLIIALILSRSQSRRSLKLSAILAIIGGVLTSPAGWFSCLAGVTMLKRLRTREPLDKKRFFIAVLLVLFVVVVSVGTNYASGLLESKKRFEKLAQIVYPKIENKEVRNSLSVEEVAFLLRTITKYNQKNPSRPANEAEVEVWLGKVLENINSKSKFRKYTTTEVVWVLKALSKEDPEKIKKLR